MQNGRAAGFCVQACFATIDSEQPVEKRELAPAGRYLGHPSPTEYIDRATYFEPVLQKGVPGCFRLGGSSLSRDFSCRCLRTLLSAESMLTPAGFHSPIPTTGSPSIVRHWEMSIRRCRKPRKTGSPET